MRFIFNRDPISQAGRRGFDPRLPLLDLKFYTCLGYLVSKESPINVPVGLQMISQSGNLP